MNALLQRVIDYFATKVVGIVVDQVEAGRFDALIEAKVETVITEMLEEPIPLTEPVSG